MGDSCRLNQVNPLELFPKAAGLRHPVSEASFASGTDSGSLSAPGLPVLVEKEPVPGRPPRCCLQIPLSWVDGGWMCALTAPLGWRDPAGARQSSAP